MRHFFTMALCAVCLPVQATLSVLACEPEWAALTQELAGDKAKIKSATNDMWIA